MWAQAPNNTGTYYRNANGKKGAALKTAMHDIISQKKKKPSYNDLWNLYKITDKRADGKVRDWYSNATNYEFGTDQAGTYKKEGDCYNREHTVPQSWFGKASPMVSDIVHVVPTDGFVNGKRGDLPLGEVKIDNNTYLSANGYSKAGTSKTPGYGGKVFEPNDEIKGDLARIYFYMATCYEGQAEDWNGESFGGTTYQPFSQWTYDMLVRWSKLDPVDEVERARNNAVYRSDVQGNRNPFVDYPGLEDYVWGSKKDVAFSYDNYDAGVVIIVEHVSQPVFSPAGGTYTDQVEVTITTATEGAAIYYTTNGTVPTESSTLYNGTITLKANTTLKAIAMKEGMEASEVTTANYVITTGGGEEPPVPIEGTFALNNSLFGTHFSGNFSTSPVTATVDGITICYDKASGSNIYMTDTHLRLYAGNTLTITSAGAPLTELEFTVILNKNNKTLQANTGSVSGYTWTGNAQSVVFSVNEGSGHLQLSQVKVTTAGSSSAVKGDVTGDGAVDWTDLSAILQSICDGNNEPQADVNHDGRVDIGDVMTIIKEMMGPQR
jgi:endonuclease I